MTLIKDEVIWIRNEGVGASILMFVKFNITPANALTLKEELMEKIIKQLLKRGDFVQAVAEETGQELARRQIEDGWFKGDWNAEFYQTLREAVNEAVSKEVEEYIKGHDVEGLIDSTFRAYIVKNLSELLEKKI